MTFRRAVCRLGLGLAFLGGCASVPSPAPPPPAVYRSEEARACAAWLEGLDRAIDQHRVRDAGEFRVPGFPYLRVNRFLASFRDELAAGPAFDAWLTRLRELDLLARQAELRNLPAAAWPALEAKDVPAALARVLQCGATMARDELPAAARQADLRRAAVVPDDYDAGLRGSPFHALARGPFEAGVREWERDTLRQFREAAQAGASPAGLRRFAFQGEPAVATSRELLARAPRDAAGIPRFPAPDLEQLFRLHAPQFEIDEQGPADRHGALRMGAAGVDVESAKAVVYRRLAYTRFEGRVLAQLVYGIWFPERPADGPFDLLSGRLDGVLVRVTLDEDGLPLLVDSIHACGCYHLFFPTPRLRARPAPDPREEWAFSPAALPPPAPGQRLVLRLAGRTHYVVQVRWAEPAEKAAEPYVFADEDGLRSLPLPGGGARSLYGPDGLVPGTERLERLFFWPMGIANAGAMRQWGRHATAFLGTRHFDDADLLARRFARAAP